MSQIIQVKMFTPCVRSGTLQGLTGQKISTILGFEPNMSESDKIKQRWSFEYEGHKCSVWDFRNASRYNQFSVYGRSEPINKLFGRRFHDQEMDDLYIKDSGQPRTRPGISSSEHLW